MAAISRIGVVLTLLLSGCTQTAVRSEFPKPIMPSSAKEECETLTSEEVVECRELQGKQSDASAARFIRRQCRKVLLLEAKCTHLQKFIIREHEHWPG